MSNTSRDLITKATDKEFLNYLRKRLSIFTGGGGGGTSNLYIQQTAPVASGNYMWVELNPDTTIKTIWINS